MARPVARWHLVGLGLFAIGFAAAGVVVATRAGGGAAYYTAVVVGLVGATVLARQGGRVATDVPTPPIWSPRGIGRVADGAGVPALPFVVAFYTLLAVSVVGNVVIPLATR